MFDLFSALQMTVNLFQERSRFPSVNLRIPRNVRRYAHINGFLGRKYLLPSVDFRPDSGIDSSFFFADDNGGKKEFESVKEDLSKRFTEEFASNRVAVKRRGNGRSVIVTAYRLDKPDLEENAVGKVVCEQFERMLLVGSDLLGQFHGFISNSPSLESLNADLANRIAVSAQDKVEARRARLAEMEDVTTPPRKIVAEVVAFDRNPDVIAEALYCAQGHCGACNGRAPFARVSDGSPFLEVHHIKPLSMGGLDRMDNILALCPNCHRDMHHGPASKVRRSRTQPVPPVT